MYLNDYKKIACLIIVSLIFFTQTGCLSTNMSRKELKEAAEKCAKKNGNAQCQCYEELAKYYLNRAGMGDFSTAEYYYLRSCLNPEKKRAVYKLLADKSLEVSYYSTEFIKYHIEAGYDKQLIKERADFFNSKGGHFVLAAADFYAYADEREKANLIWNEWADKIFEKRPQTALEYWVKAGNRQKISSYYKQVADDLLAKNPGSAKKALEYYKKADLSPEEYEQIADDLLLKDSTAAKDALDYYAAAGVPSKKYELEGQHLLEQVADDLNNVKMYQNVDTAIEYFTRAKTTPDQFEKYGDMIFDWIIENNLAERKRLANLALIYYERGATQKDKYSALSDKLFNHSYYREAVLFRERTDNELDIAEFAAISGKNIWMFISDGKVAFNQLLPVYIDEMKYCFSKAQEHYEKAGEYELSKKFSAALKGADPMLAFTPIVLTIVTDQKK